MTGTPDVKIDKAQNPWSHQGQMPPGDAAQGRAQEASAPDQAPSALPQRHPQAALNPAPLLEAAAEASVVLCRSRRPTAEPSPLVPLLQANHHYLHRM